MRRLILAGLLITGCVPLTISHDVFALMTTHVLGQRMAVRAVEGHCIDEGELTILQGNTHPLARAEFDRGAAPESLPMERMLLVLKRRPEQEAALTKLMNEQLDKSSPNYHRWLTPEQFGQQFGPADDDLHVVMAWLESHGFQVADTSKGRTVIEFSGTARQVQEAFHTGIHKYVVADEELWANCADPQVPAALAPLVVGIDTLHNFPKKPLIKALGTFSRSKAAGETKSVRPLVTFPSPCSAAGFQRDKSCYGLGPTDFASIYNLLPLWNAGIDGSGESIAIAAASNINVQDVRNFRRVFGLSANDPVIVINGPNPGAINEPQPFEKEAIIDSEWAGAVASGATIKLIVSASTNSTSGFDLSVQYAVDKNLAPILSASYSFCESSLGTAGNQFYSRLWQQAAAQGITVIIGTGDGGSAECDYERGATPPAPARAGLAVNGVASTPYNVAVGGTDFDDLTNAAKYWNAGNDSTTQASAKGYIPETTWNDSCTNALFDRLLGYSADAETNCNNTVLAKFVLASGGTGGRSACVASGCASGYPKPAWQVGPGVPNDGVRDLPDISLFAGSSVSGSFYLFCEADLQGGAACNLDGPNILIEGATGTSVSAPAFAGIMALLLQNTNARQGNANPVLYQLAAGQSGPDCDASGPPSAACIFHDVTTGTIAMPCAKGSANCITNNPVDRYGVLSGYDAGFAYDLATGLGSVDAFNLVTAAGWASGSTAVPAISPGAVLNAASFALNAPVSPGSIATVFGSFPLNASSWANSLPLPPLLTGLGLKFGPGLPVPLFYASGTQTNFQVPWELDGQSQSSLIAVVGGQASLPQTVLLAPFAPGIFSLNSQGNGQGAILDASYRLVDQSNPAHPGDIIQVYCTGLGRVTNQPSSGAAASYDPLAVTTTNPIVTIGGVEANVLFSGLTPGLVGLYQVNLEVPAAPKGQAVPLVLSIGGVISNTVTLAVQ